MFNKILSCLVDILCELQHLRSDLKATKMAVIKAMLYKQNVPAVEFRDDLQLWQEELDERKMQRNK